VYRGLVHALGTLRFRPPVQPIEPTRTLRYVDGARRGIAPLADVYEPARPNGYSVVLVHGGGFVLGSRRSQAVRYLATRFTAAGLAVCAIDYRMIFRGGRLEAAVDDVCAAFANWPGDGAALVGLSAGATLALLAAERVRPRVVVSCFGLYEVEHLRGPAIVLPRLLFANPDRATWRFAAKPAAPTLLIHGDADELVPVEQARRLAAQRTALGLPTRLVEYAGARHGFFNTAHRAADDAVHEIVRFVTGDLTDLACRA
jgi:acetyl esterase/lipase